VPGERPRKTGDSAVWFFSFPGDREKQTEEKDRQGLRTMKMREDMSHKRTKDSVDKKTQTSCRKRARQPQQRLREQIPDGVFAGGGKRRGEG